MLAASLINTSKHQGSSGAQSRFPPPRSSSKTQVFSQKCVRSHYTHFTCVLQQDVLTTLKTPSNHIATPYIVILSIILSLVALCLKVTFCIPFTHKMLSFHIIQFVNQMKAQLIVCSDLERVGVNLLRAVEVMSCSVSGPRFYFCILI